MSRNQLSTGNTRNLWITSVPYLQYPQVIHDLSTNSQVVDIGGVDKCEYVDNIDNAVVSKGIF